MTSWAGSIYTKYGRDRIKGQRMVSVHGGERNRFWRCEEDYVNL